MHNTCHFMLNMYTCIYIYGTILFDHVCTLLFVDISRVRIVCIARCAHTCICICRCKYLYIYIYMYIYIHRCMRILIQIDRQIDRSIDRYIDRYIDR